MDQGKHLACWITYTYRQISLRQVQIKLRNTRKTKKQKKKAIQHCAITKKKKDQMCHLKKKKWEKEREQR